MSSSTFGLTDLIRQQAALVKRRYPLSGLDLQQLEAAARLFRRRLLLEATPGGQFHLDIVGEDKGDFKRRIDQGGFTQDGWLLFNRLPEGAFNFADLSKYDNEAAQFSLADEGSLPTVLNGHESAYCYEKGMRVGVITPFGLSVALSESGGHTEHWQRDRELVHQWEKLGQAPQLATRTKQDTYGVFMARRLIATHLYRPNSSFSVRVPDDRYDKVRKVNLYDSAMRIYMFTWTDLRSLVDAQSVTMAALFSPNFNWQDFWTKGATKFACPPMIQLAEPPRYNPGLDGGMDEHDGVYQAVVTFQARQGSSQPGKILVLNYDAHHDRGYNEEARIERLDIGNWAGLLEQEERARVVHIPSFYNDEGGRDTTHQAINWNTPARRESILREIKAILAGENIREIWLTIEYDAFSLKTQSDYEGDWCGVYHLSPEEVQADLLALKAFLQEKGIIIHRLLPCSARTYLNIRGGESAPRDCQAEEYAKIGVADVSKGDYVRSIDGVIRRVFFK